MFVRLGLRPGPRLVRGPQRRGHGLHVRRRLGLRPGHRFVGRSQRHVMARDVPAPRLRPGPRLVSPARHRRLLLVPSAARQSRVDAAAEGTTGSHAHQGRRGHQRSRPGSRGESPGEPHRGESSRDPRLEEPCSAEPEEAEETLAEEPPPPPASWFGRAESEPESEEAERRRRKPLLRAARN